MADEKEGHESKNARMDAISTPRVLKAPPKMAPPAYAPDFKNGVQGQDSTMKKKALPPPSNPPPKTGSSAAAFRSKSLLPPPSGPPPGTGASSASVAKVRGAGRPSLTSSPASGAPAKTDSLHEVQSKRKSLPSTPPTRPLSQRMEAPSTIVPPRVESKQALASERKSDALELINGAVDSKPALLSSSRSAAAPRSGPMDVLATDVPLALQTTEVPTHPSTVPQRGPWAVPMAPDVVEDANPANYRGFQVESDATTSFSFQHEPLKGLSSQVKRAAQFSGQPRLHVPEEEVIVVKKRESKRLEAIGKPIGGGVALTGRSMATFDDSFDDVEEIPFLEEKTREHDAKELEERDDEEEASACDSPRPLHDARSDEDEQDERDAIGRRSATHEDLDDDVRTKTPGTSSPPSREPSDSEEECDHRTSRASSYDKREPSTHSEEAVSDREGRASSDRARDRDRDHVREKRSGKRRSKHHEFKRVQAQVFNPKNVPFHSEHLLEFLKRPLECGRGPIVKCFIERNDSGSNKLAPIYTLLVEVTSSSGRPILYARKNATSRITSHYVISMNKDDLFLARVMRSHHYVGKLRSSTNLMEYTLYDQGDNPDDLDSDCEVDDEVRQSIRAELAVVRYHSSKKPYPRKMEVVLPAIEAKGQRYLEWRPLSRDQTMDEHVRTIASAGGQNVIDASNFVFLHKRETKYDPLSSCIVDFRSRATCVSVKNFQLVHSEPLNEDLNPQYRKLYPDYVYDEQGTVSLPQEFVLLQLGKVGKDCFNMDFQYPLSMLQAFAISLSRFDTKQR